MGQISDSLLASLSHVLGLKKKKKKTVLYYTEESMNLGSWCSRSINHLDPIRSFRKCHFPWATFFPSILVPCLKQTQSSSFRGRQTLASHHNSSFLFEACSKAHSPRIKHAPTNREQLDPSGGQREEQGSQRISFPRSKFHSHQASWIKMPEYFHTCLILFVHFSNPFRLGTN